MAKCVVYNCQATRRTTPKGVTFHEIPSEEPIRASWLNFITGGVEHGWSPRDHSVICSRHFNDNDFMVGAKQRRLKRGTVPSVYSPFVETKATVVATTETSEDDWKPPDQSKRSARNYSDPGYLTAAKNHLRMRKICNGVTAKTENIQVVDFGDACQNEFTVIEIQAEEAEPGMTNYHESGSVVFHDSLSGFQILAEAAEMSDLAGDEGCTPMYLIKTEDGQYASLQELLLQASSVSAVDNSATEDVPDVSQPLPVHRSGLPLHKRGYLRRKCLYLRAKLSEARKTVSILTGRLRRCNGCRQKPKLAASLRRVKRDSAKGSRKAAFLLEQLLSYRSKDAQFSDKVLRYLALYQRRLPKTYEHIRRCKLLNFPSTDALVHHRVDAHVETAPVESGNVDTARAKEILIFN